MHCKVHRQTQIQVQYDKECDVKRNVIQVVYDKEHINKRNLIQVLYDKEHINKRNVIQLQYDKEYDAKRNIWFELGALLMLVKLCIYRNQLGDTIPKKLGGLHSVVEIYLKNNKLTGVILSGLWLLHLFENRLQGSIPRELGKLCVISRIDLSINNLTDAISTEFQNPPCWEYLQSVVVRKPNPW